MSSKFYKACRCARFPDMHEKQHLCEVTGFNLFLGEVQHQLIKAGYNPPIWPEPSIRDQGDLDSALDSCVKWCKALLDERAEATRNGWISVAERLPIKGERVLALEKGRVSVGSMVQHPSEFVQNGRPYYGTWLAEMSVDDHVDEVTGYISPSHWMPLPDCSTSKENP